jgi:hypothetical protein
MGELEELLATLTADPLPLLVAFGALLATVAVARTIARHAIRPQPGEIWFAEVPFQDGSGSKDRPVLVLAVDGRACTVARFTSKDRSARRDHHPVPAGVVGLGRTSWVDLRPRELPRSAFRRRAGVPGEGMVRWYAELSAGRPPGRTAATG